MELIRLYLRYGESHGFGNKCTEAEIQHILYKLKQNLPETNPIWEQLPYYWFKVGPYSEYVSDGIKKLHAEKFVTRELYENHSFIMLGKECGDSKPAKYDKNLQETSRILKQIVSDLPTYLTEEEILTQYNGAPSLFYFRFKLGFIPEMEAYRKKI